jgi:hypothetical protein
VIKRQHIKGVFQQGLVSLCQIKVILESSLRKEHSWWIFVIDITLLRQYRNIVCWGFSPYTRFP